MLQVISLAKSHGPKQLFQDVTFSLMEGQKLALVGRNGCGKSSLMNLLAGRESPDEGQIKWAKGCRVGYLDQHRKFDEPSVLEEVVQALPEHYHGLSYRAEQILTGLGMPETFWALAPHELSGGFRLRLALSVLLAQEPDLLLLDEPTNYLDMPSTLWLTRFLKSHPSAVIVISHDRGFLDSLCELTAGIYAGKFFFVRGNTALYFQHLLLKQHSQAALKQKIDRQIAKQRQFIDRFRAKASKAAQVKSREKQINKLPTVEEWILAHNLEIQIKTMDRPLERIYQVNRLEFSYHPPSPLVGPLDFEWAEVDRLALVGANGRGKSTLLKLLIGELEPVKGQIVRSPKAKIGYFGQRSIELLDVDLTPLQALMQGGQQRQLNEQDARRNLGAFAIEGDMQSRRIGTLSGGERSRVVLALIASQATHGLILDEPTHHLDIETVESLMQALKEYEGAVILVTHSPSTLETFDPDQLLVFENGEQIWYRGSYEQWIETQQEVTPAKSVPRASASKDGNFEKQRELKRTMGSLERKMQSQQQTADTHQKQIDRLSESLALAHAEHDLEKAHQLHSEMQQLEQKRDTLLHQWFEAAQTVEDIQNQLKDLA